MNEDVPIPFTINRSARHQDEINRTTRFSPCIVRDSGRQVGGLRSSRQPVGEPIHPFRSCVPILILLLAELVAPRPSLVMLMILLVGYLAAEQTPIVVVIIYFVRPVESTSSFLSCQSHPFPNLFDESLL